VGLRDAKQALLLAVVRSTVDKIFMHLLVELEGCLFLGDVRFMYLQRPDPVFFCLPLRLVPAGGVRKTCVFDGFA
jgi:hypothetical protein